MDGQRAREVVVLEVARRERARVLELDELEELDDPRPFLFFSAFFFLSAAARGFTACSSLSCIRPWRTECVREGGTTPCAYS